MEELRNDFFINNENRGFIIELSFIYKNCRKDYAVNFELLFLDKIHWDEQDAKCQF